MLERPGGIVAKVKLHRCPLVWAKLPGHACWRVQKALDEQGIEYEIVKEPVGRTSRTEVERLSGQSRLPVIEFEDGSAYREESKDMAARIRAGKLFDSRDREPAA
jgi:glutathione S-transferase